MEAELAEELDFHLEMQARKHREAGADPVEAMERARREFGNVGLAKEDARDVRGVRLLESVGQDLRYALRLFRRAPTFALAVVLTIGLGVGLNSAIFTIFDAYVLRPFEVRDPSALYSIQWIDRAHRFREFSLRDYEALKRDARTLTDVAAFRPIGIRLEGRRGLICCRRVRRQCSASSTRRADTSTPSIHPRDFAGGSSSPRSRSPRCSSSRPGVAFPRMRSSVANHPSSSARLRRAACGRTEARSDARSAWRRRRRADVIAL